ncbi:MAG: GNAT family N-acetyltransferase [Bifidobacteriaceae bacterium]|nr:GNAT family N-acetyltransferase [Bifidobacteriaceae bacterium]
MNIIDGSQRLEDAKHLIVEYTKSLGRNLDFQGLDEELQDLHKKYCAPNGRLLLAVNDEDAVIGCVAYHKLHDDICEMKRLFVLPQARGLKAGRALVSAIIESAQNNGFKHMKLDTIEPLKPAIALYKSFGFEECEAYYHNPMDDVIYMNLDL